MNSIDDSQERILRMYTVLRLLREDWGGALIAGCGLGVDGIALAMAANIAGAVCLSIEDRAEALREAMRSGSCDFIVNTLDEALRAMKNEARKHLPISIGLEGRAAVVLEEIVERGVQPQMVADVSGNERMAYREAVLQLQRSGAVVVEFAPGEARDWTVEGAVEGTVDGSARLAEFVEQRGWGMESFVVENAAGLKAFDARALLLVGEEDGLRRQWLRASSRIVQRQRPLRRALWVTAAEKRELLLPA